MALSSDMVLPRVETGTYGFRNGGDDFSMLVRRVRPFQEKLAGHFLYTRVRTLHGLRIFMKNHVFAVWDFMSLTKALQRRLTCIDVPWVPPADPTAARLINEIVLGEETDEIGHDGYMSHYRLYLKAMDEIGADKRPILEFERSIRAGLPVEQALAPLDIAEGTKLFVACTVRTALDRSDHEIAASLLLSREDLIPTMFDRVLKEMDARSAPGVRTARALMAFDEKLPGLLRRAVPSTLRAGARAWADKQKDPRAFFRIYLERHVQLDGEEHGPMGRTLLSSLCGEDATRWDEATATAREALKSRITMWDSVLDKIETEPEMVGGYRSAWAGDAAQGAPFAAPRAPGDEVPSRRPDLDPA